MQRIVRNPSLPAIFGKLEKAGIIAVIVLDKLSHALPLTENLLAGGVNAIELTLRTPVALDAAAAIKKAFPEMILGVGTLIRPEQVEQVCEIGVDFAVAPGCNPRILEEAQKAGLPFAPGVMTPTDMEIAFAHGCRMLKFFPAETSGGMAHLNSMVAPYQYLNPRFIPLGGINLTNAATYLKSPLIAAIGGSWVAKRNLIQSEDWGTIRQNATEIRHLINDIKANENYSNVR